MVPDSGRPEPRPTIWNREVVFMNGAYRLAGVLLLVGSLGACGSAADSTATESGSGSPSSQQSTAASFIDLTGTDWLLTGGTLDSIDFAKFAITAKFGEDAISGFAGVNQYNGPVKTTKKGDIKIGPLASTKMAGADDAMAAETAYLAALTAVNHYAASDSELTLTTPAGLSLKYSKA